MKSPSEFRIDVYEKRDRRIARRKRRQRLALLCVPLAVLIAAAGIFALPRLRLSPASPGNIPLALKVGSPAAVNNNFYQIALDRREAEAADDAQREDYDFLYQLYAEEIEKTLISRDFSNALDDFARDSTAVIAESFGENDCYCPLSLYYALALTGSGAAGETEREFLSLLGAEDREWLLEQCRRYYLQTYRESEYATFRLANSLWADGRCNLLPEYICGAEESFYASLFQADFTDPALGAEMGKWVSENTNGLLEPKFEPDPDTMLSLINTVYLKARWASLFWESNNIEKEFFRADGSAVTTSFMRSTDEYGSAYLGQGFIRASLYLAGGMQMIFILPDEGVSPRQLLADPQTFDDMFRCKAEEEFGRYEIHWSVPKFSIDSSFSLNDALGKLGLNTAFDPLQADFSEMADMPLYLSSARQGVRLSIDEEGLEGAAFTQIDVEVCAAKPEVKQILEMDLDRPFLFAVVSGCATDELPGNPEFTNTSDSSSVIFVGVCGDPTR